MSMRVGSGRIKLKAEESMLGKQETFTRASGSKEREMVKELGRVLKESSMKETGCRTKLKATGL
jgi:hypothetical protein